MMNHQIPKRLLRHTCLILCAAASIFPVMRADEVPTPGAALDAVIMHENIDANAYAEWVDGQEKIIVSEGRETSPEWVIWTDKTLPGHSGRSFGKSENPGIRHLRIGFVSPVPMGTVIVKGGGRLSVL